MESFAVLSQATLWDNALSYPNLVGVAIKYLGLHLVQFIVKYYLVVLELYLKKSATNCYEKRENVFSLSRKN